ncbi:hypothetical protein [Anaeromassilibacillus sp. SJQ-1]|uniref:hypothetical protein n=1 Tax=Anaeromassilibacillus sp. SJQ-1 TaxID=3375419 RepID=UPI00398A1E23
MMGQMRKGFVYQNLDAAVGEARCHRFVLERTATASCHWLLPSHGMTSSVTRVAGDFEDEILITSMATGNPSKRFPWAPRRMTYEQILCPNDTLLLNNSYLLQQSPPYP